MDLCCGTMANSIPLTRSKRNIEVPGIDLSRQMLQVAKQRAKNGNLSNISMKCADATNTNMKADCADYIILGLALHEMKPELQKRVLAEAHRLLKADGSLIVLEWEKRKPERVNARSGYDIAVKLMVGTIGLEPMTPCL